MAAPPATPMFITCALGRRTRRLFLLQHLLALALTLPVFVLLMGRVQRLYRILHHANRKIKNIQEDAQRDGAHV